MKLMSFIGTLLFLGVTKKRNVDVAEIWSSTSTHYLEYVTLIMPRSVDKRTGEDSKFHMMEYVFSLFANNIRNHTAILVLTKLYMDFEVCSHFDSSSTASQQSMVSNTFSYVMLRHLTSVTCKSMWERIHNKMHEIRTSG